MGDAPEPQQPRAQHPPLRLSSPRQIARRATFRWPVRRVPTGWFGVVPDHRSSTPSANTVLPPGWHFLPNGRLAVVPGEIDTGDWPVSSALEAEPAYWVRATCTVEDPRVAALAVADLPTAIVQQLRVAVRAATSGSGSIDSDHIANSVRELITPIFSRWGVSIQNVSVMSAP
jgi:hypothetical protein